MGLGVTPLLIACSYGQLDVVKFLLGDKDIDFNVVDDMDKTVLHRACFYGHIEVVRFLLKISREKGIDIEKKANNGRTAKDMARQNRYWDVVQLLNLWHIWKQEKE